MVNFKTSSGVTISIPGKLEDRDVQKAIRDIRLNELKEAMKSANKDVKASTAKKQKRGGVSKKRGGVRRQRCNMATSNTTTFNLSFDSIIERAYARCGKSMRTGYELRAARDNLNLLFSEWGNRGIHLWKVKNHTQNLTAGTTTYTAPSDASDVLELVFRKISGSTTTDTSMTKISRSEYENVPNKFEQGQPSQYFIQRNLSNVEINLYQTPNETDTQINYFYVGRIEDVGAYTNEPDAPFRFLPCTVAGLAYYLGQEIAPERSQELERRYEAELQRALTEDSQSTSVNIVPRSFYVG